MATAENLLIEALPRDERLRLRSACEPVELAMAEVLYEPDRLAQHVYFPTGAFISMLAVPDDNPGLEVAMVGREGMLGAQVALGVPKPGFRAQVQGPGPAWRIGALAFGAELARNPELQRSVHRYIHVLIVQLASAAACQRFHMIDQRLARWLLMCQDRAPADHFPVTHEALAGLLGVRRVGITHAVGSLQRLGLIAHRRGDIQVLDRDGLLAAACGCYAADRRAYQALF